MVALLDVGRQAISLCVDDAHLQRCGAQRQLPPDFSQSDDSELPLVKSYEPGDARPVAIGRMRAIVARRRVASRAQLFLAYEVHILVELAGQRQHQRKSLLGGGNIGAASKRQYLNAGAVARCAVNSRSRDAVFLYDLESLSCSRDFCWADCQ